MEMAARYWDRLAYFYSKQSISNEVAYRKKLRQIQDILRPQDEVFEFGCGTGTTAAFLAPFVRHIDAMDISSEMLWIARRHAFVNKVNNITFVKGDIETVDISLKQYDVVMGNSVLHLVQDYKTVLARVDRLLKPGGYFVTTTPCLSDSSKWLKAFLPLGRVLGLTPDMLFFTQQELTAAIQALGFDVEVQWQPSKKESLFVIARKKKIICQQAS